MSLVSFDCASLGTYRGTARENGETEKRAQETKRQGIFFVGRKD